MADQGKQPMELPEGSKETIRKGRGKAAWRELKSLVATLLLAVVIAMPVRAFLFEPIRVDGRSMLETLQDGEVVLVTKPAVLLNRLERGDVVIVRFPNRSKATKLPLGGVMDMELVQHELFVKRLVALPGDSAAVIQGRLYVNDLEVREDYIKYPPRQDFPRVVLGEDEYMVMGDNRANSHDSRSRDVGPISRDMIVGRASYVLLPLTSARPIH